MKRLLELPAEDRLTARAQKLVDAMGKTPELEHRLRRVWLAVNAHGAAHAQRWPVRGALVAGLLAAGTAAAAGGGALGTLFESTPAAEAGVVQSLPLPLPPPLPQKRRLPNAPAPVAEAALAEAPSVAPPEPLKSETPGPHAGRNTATTTSSDVARVHEAAKALRGDGNSERALQLLEGTSERSTGPLAEEALALRIEAARSHHAALAVKLAATYLTRYPQGRYRSLAQQTLSEHGR